MSSAITVILEIINGNVIHLENGREPNATVALFPIIPMAQISYLMAAWLTNKFESNFGFKMVGAWFIFIMILKVILIKRAQIKLIKLKEALSSQP